MKSFSLVILLLFFPGKLFPQSYGKTSKDEYIQKYKDIAIEEMNRSGIPASITLAQGMLESNNGNSTLAREANNHFGIKCHDWNGKKIYHDDETRNECFRKYKNPEESFHDHTDFLLSKPRYSFLFNYKSTDYKNWAKGLKKAGYATNPSYSGMLIKIIEDNQLYMFDNPVTAQQRPASHYPGFRRHQEDPDFSISLNTRPIYQKNNVDYIMVKNGDSFDKISREMDMLNWELYRYNELTKDSVLREGEILYIQPKRRKAAFGNNTHTVVPGETIYSISQSYGIRSASLRRLNRLQETDSIAPGQILSLRKRIKKIETCKRLSQV